ncbi:hypothetical protein B566_EDAN002459 [Ephemera danica]|nr:hypothetical protein B566_EDAN002459 [Ephemera danica]
MSGIYHGALQDTVRIQTQHSPITLQTVGMSLCRKIHGSSNLSRRQEVDEGNAESRKAAEITGQRGRASATKTTAPSSRKPGQRWSLRATSERPSPSEPLSGEESPASPRQHKESPAPSQRSRPERGRRKYNTNIVASQNSRNLVASQNNNEAKNESISESHTQRTDAVTPKHTRSTTAQRRTSKSSDELDISEDDNYPEAFKQQILSKKPATVSSTPSSRSRNSKNVSTESPDTAETSTPATSTNDGRIESPSRRRTTNAPEITTHKGSVNSRNAILRQASRVRNSPKSTESVTEITQITSITTGGTSRVRYSAKHRRLHTPAETKESNDTARPKQRFSAKFNSDVKNEIKSDSAVASTIPNAVTEPSTKVPTRRLRDKFPSSTPRASSVPIAPSQKTKVHDVTNIPVPEIESTTSSSSIHSTPKTEPSPTTAKPIETATASANDIQKNRSRSISYNAPPNRGNTRSSNSPDNTTSHNSYNKRTPVDTVALNINSISSDDEINQVTRNISISKPNVVEVTINHKPNINGSSTADKNALHENRGAILINEILQVPTVTSTTVKPNKQTNHGTLLIREILPSSTEDFPRWSTPKSSNVVAEQRQNTTEKVLLNASKPVISNEILGVPEPEIVALRRDPLSLLFTEPVQSVTSSSTTVQYTGSYAKYTSNKDSQRQPTTPTTRIYSTTPRSIRSSTTKPSTTEESTISSTQDSTTQKCLDGTMSKILCLVNATHLRVLKTPTITPDTYITSASNEVTKVVTSTVRTTSVEPVTSSRAETSPLRPLALVAEETPLSLPSEINNVLKKSARSNEAVITVTPSATLTTASLLALHFPELDDTNEAANSDSTTTSRSTYIYRIPPNKQSQNGRGRNRARGAKYNSATTEIPSSTTTTARPTTVPVKVPLLSLNSAAELAALFKETQNQRLTNKPEYNKVVRTPSYRTPAPTTTTTSTTQKSSSALRLEDLQPATNVDTPSLNVDGLTQQDLLILELLSKRRPVLNEPATTAAPDDGGLLLSSLLADTQKAKSFHRAVPATTTERPFTTTQAYVVHAQAENTGGGSNLFSILRQISGGSSGFQQAPAVQQVKDEDIYIEPSTAAPAIPSRTSKRQRNNLRGSRTTTVPPPEDVYLIDEQEAANNQQSNLVSVAINVTKSVAGFMGRFLQGAARTVTSVVSTSGRTLANYLQTWQNPPAAPQY